MTQRVFITGATSGIGLATARRFAAEGAALVLAARDGARLAAVAASLPAGTRIVLAPGDVCDAQAVARNVARAEAELGGIDVLVTCAGMTATAPALEVTPEEFRRHLELNVTGSWLCAQAVARGLVARRAPGAIVMIGSVYGATGAPQRTAYCASKGAVHNMVASLAVEWGPLGIRVNAVAPTGTRTPLVERLIAAGSFDLAAVTRRTPLGRLAALDDVVEGIAFLASDRAAMITGHVLPIDGGWLANGYITAAT